MRVALFLIVATAALAGCKADLTTTVYLGDVLDLAAAPTKSVMVPAQLSVQMLSQKTCMEKGGEAVELLKPFFQKVGQGVCRQAGFNGYLDVPIEMPVYGAKIGDTMVPPNSTVGVAVASSTDGTVIYASVDPVRLKAVRDAVQQKYMQKIELTDISITVTLNNDSRSKVRVKSGSAWIAGKPEPWFTDFEIDRRGTLDIRLSDVATATVMKTTGHAFALLPPAP